MIRRLALCCFTIVGTVAAHAEPVDISGFVEGEVRIFPAAPKFPAQHDDALSPSLAFQPELRWKSDNHDTFTFIPFGRIDADDKRRTHWDVREANWLYNAGDWDLRVGLGKVFWGVAESRHLVDIINQTDLVESVEEEDKLGQPMVNLNLITDFGTWNAFVLPYFRERTFPSSSGRPGLPLPVATDLAVFESGSGERHVDYALRWQERVGAFDIGLSYFDGTGREPRLVPTLAPGGPVLVPHYDLIDQAGLDVQATLDSWLLKLEAIVRSGQGDTFFASVTGFEYTFYQVFGSQADLGALAEYDYDGRDANAPYTLFNNDIVLGARLALNDVEDTSFLSTMIVDLDNHTTLSKIEFATRVADGWKLEIDGRFFLYVDNHAIETNFERDHTLEIRLRRYF
ncbi:MAG: hypothetical protein GC190_18590 [Alphaproteobacteria bacterium]|nr:hypothetical protein [Alphaproteobacteria bacterium]